MYLSGSFSSSLLRYAGCRVRDIAPARGIFGSNSSASNKLADRALEGCGDYDLGEYNINLYSFPHGHLLASALGSFTSPAK